MYNELFESIIRTSGENTDYLDDFNDRADNFWAPVPVIEQMFERALKEAEQYVYPHTVAKAGRTISHGNAENDTKQELWKKGEWSILITLPTADKNGDPVAFRMRFAIDRDNNGNPLTFKDVDQSVSINEAANEAKEFMDQVCSILENDIDSKKTTKIPYPREDSIKKNQYADGAKTEILKQYGKVEQNKTPDDVAGTISSMGTHLPKGQGIHQKKKPQ